MNQHSPLFLGTIATSYSQLIHEESPLQASDDPKPGTGVTDLCSADGCGTVMESHPVEGDAVLRCVPSTQHPCETPADKPYSALAAVHAGWVLPPQPRA